jgi:hypothetical protein
MFEIADDYDARGERLRRRPCARQRTVADDIAIDEADRPIDRERSAAGTSARCERPTPQGGLREWRGRGASPGAVKRASCHPLRDRRLPLAVAAAACLLISGCGSSSSNGANDARSGGSTTSTGGHLGTTGIGGSGATVGPGVTQTGGDPGTGGGSTFSGAGGFLSAGGVGGGSALAGPGVAGATGSGGTAGSSAAAGGGAALSSYAVVTDRYDNARSGANTAETQLTTSNVTAAQFGLLFSRSITGLVYGQPLYAGGISVSGVKHNVVYVATEHNMVYAFDADSASATTPLWSRSLGPSLSLTTGYNPGCGDMHASGEVGITSTPVISLPDNVIYVVAKTSTDQQLHALDLGTGADIAGSPSTIGAGPMTFDPKVHLNRPGLLLLNGTIYVAYGSHCDAGNYHGWILGYDAKTLQLQSVFNSTPSGTQGAIWQAGSGLSTDGTDIWVAVGNGSTNGNNTGFSVVRLTPSGGALTIAARYQNNQRVPDNDVQSGVTILGNTGQVVAGNKAGDITLLGQSDLSRKQNLMPAGSANLFAFWDGSAGPTLFAWPENGSLYAYRVGAGSLTQMGTNSEQTPEHPGGTFTVSSNGRMPGTGILWATVPVLGDAWHATATGTLYAFDASDVTKHSLWNSDSNAADRLGTYAKFSPPMVANGKVYVATFSGALRVYGLK